MKHNYIIVQHVASDWLHHCEHKTSYLPVERYCVNKSVRMVASELPSIQFTKSYVIWCKIHTIFKRK